MNSEKCAVNSCYPPSTIISGKCDHDHKVTNQKYLVLLQFCLRFVPVVLPYQACEDGEHELNSSFALNRND